MQATGRGDDGLNLPHRACLLQEDYMGAGVCKGPGFPHQKKKKDEKSIPQDEQALAIAVLRRDGNKWSGQDTLNWGYPT